MMLMRLFTAVSVLRALYMPDFGNCGPEKQDLLGEKPATVLHGVSRGPSLGTIDQGCDINKQ